MIRKCPDQAVPTLKSIFKLTSEAITYDPNYNYQDDEDMGGGDQDMDDDEGWGDYDGEDEQVDADDTAWKVRKSAVKVIDAVIMSCPAYLREFWISYVELLQSRFIERDDNVKCDILQTFQNLVKASVVVDQSTASADYHTPLTMQKTNS